MGEGQRIEGQMYRASGLYWGMAIMLLVMACGGVLVFGYFIKWWASAAGNWAAAMGGGGAAGGVAVMPVPMPTAVPSSSVPWPVAAGASFREHWEGRAPGVNTLFAGYWKPASAAGWEHVWSTGVILPIEGENELVLVVQVPRDQTPDAASEGMAWVCPVELNAAGDYVPVFMDIRAMAMLRGEWVRRMWERGLPEGVAAHLVKRTRAGGGRAGPWTMVDLSEFFSDAEPDAAEGGSAAGPR
ncbi:MAG: hypothetical protein KF699_05610 [Phycisphaeraceae bacterium]|nr:hypothetical protein [Phycisphaeraceae bacterium]MBX3408103.1 hypothetical protein [Phycisphaeraceae bacterium]